MYLDALYGILIGFVIGFFTFAVCRFSVSKYNLKKRRGFYTPVSYSNSKTSGDQSILDSGLGQNPDNTFK